MKTIRFFLIFCAMALHAKAESVARSFELPLANYPTDDYCLGWGGYNASYSGRHVADDACAPAGSPVYAVGNGVVKFAGEYKACPNWGSLMIVEHTLADDKKVCSIYGHVMPISGITAGDTVTIGDHIGAIEHFGCWTDHIHFGIYEGPYSDLTCNYNVSTGAGSCKAHGYLPQSMFPGKYRDPVKFVKNFEPYRYDHDAYSCAGPVTGGEQSDWYYSCLDARPYFTAGEPVTVMLRLHDIGVNHRFKVAAYKDGVPQWEWSPGWNYVDPATGWKYSHFWPTLWDSTPGYWMFRFSVDLGAGYQHLDDVYFRVDAPTSAYTYDYNATTCKGPVDGGWWTNWYYTCEQPTKSFHTEDTVNALIRINEVWADHSFKVVTYKDGVYQWEWSPGWNDVDESSGWDYSHFWFSLSDSIPGNWKFDIYIDSGAGYQHTDTLTFLVSP